MGSKVPGAVVTDPPTAKLPCAWIIRGSGLLLLVSCAPAEVKRQAVISQSAMKDFQCFLLMEFAPLTLRSKNFRFLFPGSCFCMIFPAICPSFLLENFSGNVDGGNRVRPASVKRQVSDGLDQLLLCHAVFARPDEVRPKLLWTVQGNQRSHSHQAPVTLRELRTLPDVAVQHVVSQL